VYSKVTKIRNISGLHARPASDFVACAKGFSARIKLNAVGGEDGPVNAKSIVMVLSLGLSAGTEVEVIAEGDDEEAAVDALVSLVESGFGEELSC